MARGWESKSVDDQMADAEQARAQRRAPVSPPADPRRDTLSLARARTLQSLQSACDARYRAMLEQALADLDAQIARLDSHTP